MIEVEVVDEGGRELGLCEEKPVDYRAPGPVERLDGISRQQSRPQKLGDLVRAAQVLWDWIRHLSCAFGIRNLEHLETGLREFCRVLDGDGRAVILEFSLPKNAVLRQLFLFYFLRIMPSLAGWISGDRTGAYRYLPRSVLRFPERRQIVDQLRRAGFERVEVHPLTFGIAVAYLAFKSP